jgi:hypothetical protein
VPVYLMRKADEKMHSKRKPAYQGRSFQPTSAHRDAWYDVPSHDTLVPEAFFDSRVKLATVSPETALMYAVLEDAFLCFHKDAADQRRMQSAREAREWFFNDNSSWLFAFLPICDALGLEPRYIRTKLRHWTPSRPDTMPATPGPHCDPA